MEDALVYIGEVLQNALGVKKEMERVFEKTLGGLGENK